MTVKQLIEALSVLPDYYEVAINTTGSQKRVKEVLLRTPDNGKAAVEIR